MDFCNNKTPHPPHVWGIDFNECPGVAHDEDEVLPDGQTIGSLLAKETVHLLAPADYERIAKMLMEMTTAEAAARQARELEESNSITFTLNVHDWLQDPSDTLGYIGDTISTLLATEPRRSTGTFTVSLSKPGVPKALPNLNVHPTGPECTESCLHGFGCTEVTP